MKRSTWGDIEEMKTWLSQWMFEITYISYVHYSETFIDIPVLLLPLTNNNDRLIWSMTIVWYHIYWQIRSTLRLRAIDTHLFVIIWLSFYDLDLITVFLHSCIWDLCKLALMQGYNLRSCGRYETKYVRRYGRNEDMTVAMNDRNYIYFIFSLFWDLYRHTSSVSSSDKHQ